MWPSVYRMTLDKATVLVLAFCIACVTCLLAWKKKGLKGRLPPGPTPLPLIGNLLQLNAKDMFRSLLKLRDTYGPVFTVYLSFRPVVILCGYKAVKEALVNQGEEFSGRGYLPLAERTSNGHGVIIANGERWKQLRRFSITSLRNFGMGKRSLEERIQEEAQFLAVEFRETKELPFDPTFFFSRAVANVICSVVFGDRFDYKDRKFLTLLGLVNETFRLASSTWGQLYAVFPDIMDYLPGPHNQLFKNAAEIKKFASEIIEAHQKTLNPDVPRDFVDCFLIQMEQEKENYLTEFNIENLTITSLDIFFAGTETTSTTLRYGLLLLLKYPEVADTIYQEIERVIGRTRCPSVEHRHKMPYTDAVIHEIQRFSNVLPMGIPRAVTRDTQFRDYLITKGTSVFPILGSVLHDPTQFPNPETFNPGRFLDDRGGFMKNDAFMPFSTGKRNCLGEGLARMQLFLFLTTILQKFTLKSPKKPEEINITPEVSSLGNLPRPYLLCVIPR
ncbi:cytochrome P450 2G1 [Microcaecilia unicolor]|uniref:Cytochrome P450 2G1-like n=1 Tax=Microcaecilia unicolor TaxID=1415580 RepID=A0A6P7ZRG3_9AMPH|nr:cytochrome P450 2G1-like [Microcaecilia unicolor]